MKSTSKQTKTNLNDETIIDFSTEKSGKAKEFFSKLSKGLMLPIALLPLAGLLLGFGAGLSNILLAAGVNSTSGIFIIPTLMNAVGNVIFANLPILFALAVAIAYTDDAGVAGFTALIAYLGFNATQMVFISDGYYLGDGTLVYNIFIWKAVPSTVVVENLGITSLSTSVFGGMVIGGVAAYSYNTFKTTQLPKVLGFFSGTRMVPMAGLMIGVLAGLAFLIIWPPAGIFLDWLGKTLATLPIGVDTFIYGFVQRLLCAFGLHHAFYTPLWFTSIGGQLIQDGVVVAEGNNTIWQYINGQHGLDFSLTFDALTNATVKNGFYTLETPMGITYQLTEGVSPASYMQGGYPIMMFGLPAAGLAMVFAAKKDNRELAMSVIGAAAFTSLLTGITEPLEYTFLFLSPMLYVIHAFYMGISYAALDLVGANIGVSFSTGIIDLCIFGILPSATGNPTGWWWAIVFGIIYAPLYYFTFYFWITHFNLATPGRANNEVKLINKKDYLASKNKKSKQGSNRSERVEKLVTCLGGFDNLTSIDACITRLRLSIVNKEKVDEKGLKDLGAVGVLWLGTKGVQIIFGAEADLFKHELKELQKNQNK